MSEELKPPILVAKDKLSPEALLGVIKEFIMREGTDYGHAMPGLEDKIKKVEKQIESGRALIVYDPNTETCSLLRKEQLEKMGVIDAI